MIEKIKRIKGRQWSQQQGAWLLPLDKDAWASFQQEFRDTLYIIIKEGQEIVHEPEETKPKKVSAKKADFWKGRLRLDFPYRKDWVEKIKQIEGRRWHPEHNCWTIPDSPLSMAQSTKHFGDDFHLDIDEHAPTIPSKRTNSPQAVSDKAPAKYHEELTKLEEKLTLRRMSHHTILDFGQFLAARQKVL
ncbi:MAG: hypothetical protein K9J37_10055 [Saprospiraceae bacterium]|nr:hypothetical protein [Saprospiraceae bacterium]MCF8250245.1 hypothetical protein [Saprospiraceae bacterium]MCF8280927.1 hypothetical protein [Bacteroidales bacterium]MCF8312123.1 hypothetical protein [Saprospiraceae bacterium]MCF8440530.1 hypothetical protein [Saprospiraceae bacterium]